MGIALFLTVQLEGNLLNPYILGKAVRIHPLAILATVTGGTLLGGVFGAFVAVPLVAIVNNVVLAVRAPLPREAVETVQSGDIVQQVLDDPEIPSPGEEATVGVAAGTRPPSPPGQRPPSGSAPRPGGPVPRSDQDRQFGPGASTDTPYTPRSPEPPRPAR